MVIADKLFIVIQFDVKDSPADGVVLAAVHDGYIFQRQMGAFFQSFKSCFPNPAEW